MKTQTIKGIVTGRWSEQAIIDEFVSGWAEDVLYDDVGNLAQGDADDARKCEITFIIKIV